MSEGGEFFWVWGGLVIISYIMVWSIEGLLPSLLPPPGVAHYISVFSLGYRFEQEMELNLRDAPVAAGRGTPISLMEERTERRYKSTETLKSSGHIDEMMGIREEDG